jgi:hypothetical protein
MVLKYFGCKFTCPIFRGAAIGYINGEIYFLGDLNIDCLATSCPVKWKCLIVTNACSVTKVIASTIFHIFNQSLKECVCPQAWKEAKVIPLPKKSNTPFAGSNSPPISLLPVLRKIK